MGNQDTDNLPNSPLLTGVGRDIDGTGKFEIEFTPDRTRDDLFNNRPGAHLREKILNLPESPGVYMYIDRHGKVIYVGKAKRLKRRVSSYFNRRHDSVKTNLLVRNIVDMRFIVVATEEDALHLESGHEGTVSTCLYDAREGRGWQILRTIRQPAVGKSGVAADTRCLSLAQLPSCLG